MSMARVVSPTVHRSVRTARETCGCENSIAASVKALVAAKSRLRTHGVTTQPPALTSERLGRLRPRLQPLR
jgi:hypothetical protein